MLQPSKVTSKTLLDLKNAGKRFACLTAYDTPSARLAEQAGMDVILVGDSLGTTILGLDATTPVTLENMIYHTQAVRRGVKQALLVTDLPYEASQGSPQKITANAKRLVKEAGTEAVKIEGPVFDAIREMTAQGISVMGHLGLLPQTALQTGGLKVRAKSPEEAEQLIADAQEIQKAGAFALVLECIPWPLAERVTKALKIPTIGIGAGPKTDGQILVWHDCLGGEAGKKHKFVRHYLNFAEDAVRALKTYRADVMTERFPSLDESFK